MSDAAVLVSELLARSGPIDERVIAAKVGTRIRDLHTRLGSEEAALPISAIRLGDPEALEVIRHSAAHVMADVVQQLFPGTKIANGPAVDTGFYYDLDPPQGAFTEEDLGRIEAEMKKRIAAKLPFRREVVTREFAKEVFTKRGETYKLDTVETRPEGEEITIYHHGPWFDLCEGPHVPNTGTIGAVKLMSVAGAYWHGDVKNKMLSRIYGTAFSSEAELKKHLALLEEAKKRDHRKIGRDLDLFSVDETVGAGLVLWHPKGALARYVAEEFWRTAHLAGGYDLVYSPHVGRRKLWETSGHTEFFVDRMYPQMDVEGSEYFVRPMNCPFHVTIFRSRLRSYRELPLRWAELGTVYRYEQSGELHGLLRVRGFTQDDAHLFIRPEQIEEELQRTVRFVTDMLKSFGFESFQVELSTRPQKAVGDIADWDRAEAALRGAVEAAGLAYSVDAGGGAFYGPKIDIKIEDCLGRKWQCSTVQLDFNLPERFDLEYVGEDGKRHRPVMIHRALLGSMERFFAVMTEHYAGAFPAWLAPEQAALLTLADRHAPFAEEALSALRAAGIRATLDASNAKLGAKIRESAMRKIPFVCVIGDKEVEGRGLALRTRAGGDQGFVPLQQAVDRISDASRVPRLGEVKPS